MLKENLETDWDNLTKENFRFYTYDLQISKDIYEKVLNCKLCNVPKL